MAKVTGKVKWFSNRKGFGFIDPVSDNSPTKEPIFVHQTVIQSDGEYRTLTEGAEVEFDVETEESGKLKAINVTGPGGAAIKPPAKRERKKRAPREAASGGESTDEGAKPNGRNNSGGGGGGSGNNKNDKKKEKPPMEPPFHDVINAESKKKIADKGVELGTKVTIDVALGNARIKLGQGGYAGIADASGKVGEGSYTCDASGEVKFTWEKCIVHADGKWSSGDVASLPKSFSLANDAISPVGVEETAESLWGADKVDPKDALVENGFKMKRIVLTRPPNAGRNKRRIPRKRNNKKDSSD